MRYAVRKRGTDKFLNEGAGYSPLDNAFIYDDLQLAREDCYATDEVVAVTLVVEDGVPPEEETDEVVITLTRDEYVLLNRLLEAPLEDALSGGGPLARQIARKLHPEMVEED